MDAIHPDRSEAVTGQLLTQAGGDRCAVCQSSLASDQRYCITCGERRGKARFSFTALAAEAAPASAPPVVRRRPRISPSTTLVAGVATLLLAMGIGFMIGHNNTNGATRAAAATPQVIKIDATGGGGSAGTARAATSTSKKKVALGSFTASTVPKITPKVAAAATAAANHVLGASANNLAPVTVQPGQACSHGAGCQGGKFTGQFFGP